MPLQFKDVSTGKDLPDVLERVKFSSMAWTHDNKGIFYNVRPVKNDTRAIMCVELTTLKSSPNQFSLQIYVKIPKNILQGCPPCETRWLLTTSNHVIRKVKRQLHRDSSLHHQYILGAMFFIFLTVSLRDIRNRNRNRMEPKRHQIFIKNSTTTC